MTCLPKIESRFGRAHLTHKASMGTTATSEYPIQRSTFAAKLGMVGLSATVRHLTETMLAGWDELPMGRRVPADRRGE